MRKYFCRFRGTAILLLFGYLRFVLLRGCVFVFLVLFVFFVIIFCAFSSLFVRVKSFCKKIKNKRSKTALITSFTLLLLEYTYFSYLIKITFRLGIKSNQTDFEGRNGYSNKEAQGRLARDLINAVVEDDLVKLKRLLSSGVSPNVCNSEGSTALHEAAKYSRTEVINLLVKYGASVNTVTLFGNTPLHHAVVSHSTAVIKLLLLHKANARLRNIHNESPLDRARQLKREGAVRLLKKYSWTHNSNTEWMHLCYTTSLFS